MFTPLTLEEAHHRQFKMLCCLHDFCMQHHIPYFLAFGTLLGAVRHGGFIPWDDDVDVIMHKSDFLKLLATFRHPDYELSYPGTTVRHNISFARMSDRRTCLRYGTTSGMGLFIDIYIAYTAPDDSAEQQNYLRSISHWAKVEDFFRRLPGWLARHHLYPFAQLRYGIANSFLQKSIQRMSIYEESDTKSLFVDSGDTLFYPSHYFSSFQLMNFETRQFCVPTHYHKLLTMWYGDYKQLPPVEQRKSYHNVEKVHLIT